MEESRGRRIRQAVFMARLGVLLLAYGASSVIYDALNNRTEFPGWWFIHLGIVAALYACVFAREKRLVTQLWADCPEQAEEDIRWFENCYGRIWTDERLIFICMVGFISATVVEVIVMALRH